MKNLKTIRNSIDDLDQQLLELVGQRIILAKMAGEKKKEAGLAIYDPERESLILEEISNKAANHDLNKRFVQTLYTLIINECREAQK